MPLSNPPITPRPRGFQAYLLQTGNALRSCSTGWFQGYSGQFRNIHEIRLSNIKWIGLASFLDILENSPSLWTIQLYQVQWLNQPSSTRTIFLPSLELLSFSAMSPRSVESLIKFITFPIKPAARISIEHDIGANGDDGVFVNPDSPTGVLLGLLVSNVAANSESVSFEFIGCNGGIGIYLQIGPFWLSIIGTGLTSSRLQGVLTWVASAAANRCQHPIKATITIDRFGDLISALPHLLDGPFVARRLKIDDEAMGHLLQRSERFPCVVAVKLTTTSQTTRQRKVMESRLRSFLSLNCRARGQGTLVRHRNRKESRPLRYEWER